MGQRFWRSLTTRLDNVIKANSTAQVIPSVEAIAMEAPRHHREHVIDQHGSGVSKENWSEHKNETDMVRAGALAYREIDGGRDREIVCPVCHEYGRGVAANALFCSNQRSKYLKKAIAMHMAIDAHSKALTEKERERTR